MLVFFLIAANIMDNLKTPFKGVLDDVKGRLACYKKDWLDTCGSGARCISFRLFLMEGGGGGGCISAIIVNKLQLDLYCPLPFQDSGPNSIYFLCFCSPCNCLWGAIES